MNILVTDAVIAVTHCIHSLEFVSALALGWQRLVDAMYALLLIVAVGEGGAGRSSQMNRIDARFP